MIFSGKGHRDLGYKSSNRIRIEVKSNFKWKYFIAKIVEKNCLIISYVIFNSGMSEPRILWSLILSS